MKIREVFFDKIFGNFRMSVGILPLHKQQRSFKSREWYVQKHGCETHRGMVVDPWQGRRSSQKRRGSQASDHAGLFVLS